MMSKMWNAHWLLIVYSVLKLCACAQWLSHVRLCDPRDCSPPGSSVHGVSQVRTLEWVAISFSRRSSRPRDWTRVCCIDRKVLYHWATKKALSRLPCRQISFWWVYSNVEQFINTSTWLFFVQHAYVLFLLLLCSINSYLIYPIAAVALFLWNEA